MSTLKVGLPVFILVLLIVIFAPFALVWSLNTLFPVLAIPYTLETWLASLILGGTVKASTSK